MYTRSDEDPAEHSDGTAIGPETVESTKLLGALVMAGTYADGWLEIRVSDQSPANAEDAAHRVQDRLLPEGSQ
ncbi:hypothetical protein HSRCO_0756 [Halanaeroarchaeum sp. HSR-CO]|uniref:hypothetical protein n=1 Tax=Halanaeroarchaeum sp. HSR-CO TaxID=2866382 RepID=UPI00217D5D29|nr:hypothetical protein [Halanaeroarchaeum sp. HSR-CO]UWG47050.1 hypothetical protein HSRCO_0756 [Halanaeroarchaeum sp. HSR-CO]